MKELSNTKVTVRLRKVEDRKEWYVYPGWHTGVYLKIYEKYSAHDLLDFIYIQTNKEGVQVYWIGFSKVILLMFYIMAVFITQFRY